MARWAIFTAPQLRAVSILVRGRNRLGGWSRGYDFCHGNATLRERSAGKRMDRRVMRPRLFALLLASAVLSQAEKLPLKIYMAVDGLAHNTVNRIVRDSYGHMWFCTSEGLSRFDGYEFYNYRQRDGLPHRDVHDLLETKRGDFWISHMRRQPTLRRAAERGETAPHREGVDRRRGCQCFGQANPCALPEAKAQRRRSFSGRRGLRQAAFGRGSSANRWAV